MHLQKICTSRHAQPIWHNLRTSHLRGTIVFAKNNCKQNLWIAILLGHVTLTVFKHTYLSLISLLLCIASHITMCSAFIFTYVQQNSSNGSHSLLFWMVLTTVTFIQLWMVKVIQFWMVLTTVTFIQLWMVKVIQLWK